jgi:hypothetical protein
MQGVINHQTILATKRTPFHLLLVQSIRLATIIWEQIEEKLMYISILFLAIYIEVVLSMNISTQFILYSFICNEAIFENHTLLTTTFCCVDIGGLL